MLTYNFVTAKQAKKAKTPLRSGQVAFSHQWRVGVRFPPNSHLNLVLAELQ